MTSRNPFLQSLKLKLWWRRLSVSSPKMTIESHLPWSLKMLIAITVVGLGGALALWVYDLGRSFAGFNPGASVEKIAALREQIDKIKAERDQYSSTVNAAESQMNIEHSAQSQLATQIKTLEAENSKLKEDLAFFESLLPVDANAQGVSIRRLLVERVTPNQFRYRLLIMQGGKGEHDFIGNLQLSVTVLQGGKSAMMVYPEANAADADKFKLGFKHYQRIEGVLTLPEGVVMKTVQARILDKGQIRAQQTSNL